MLVKKTDAIIGMVMCTISSAALTAVIFTVLTAVSKPRQVRTIVVTKHDTVFETCDTVYYDFPDHSEIPNLK